jgi:aldose 1-epimerase
MLEITNPSHPSSPASAVIRTRELSIMSGMDGMADLGTVRIGNRELQVTFVPGAGMVCCSLRHRGEELLAQRAGLQEYAAHGHTMGIPLLYPWANRLAADEYTAAGRTVQIPNDPALIARDGAGLPIHGAIGGRQGWELEPGSDGGASEPQALTARLTWSEDSRWLWQIYPFRHDVHYEALIDGDCLRVSITVVACGEDRVPVAFGLHPYLSPPGAQREDYAVELPAMRHLDLDAHQIPTGSGQPAATRRFRLGEEEFDDGFDQVADGATFVVGAAQRRIELKLVEGYPCAQVYAPRDGQFICFEPMTAPANALRSGDGLRVLEPGERHRATFELRVWA